MNTRIGFWVTSVLAIGVSAGASADQHWGYQYGRPHHDQYEAHAVDQDYARVVNVDPIMTRVRVSSPTRQCWNESQTAYSNPHSSVPGATFVGTLIGGVVGHRIGHFGGGHDPVATVAGGLIGAAIGHGIGESRDAARGADSVPVERNVERCNVDYHESWEEHIDGYRVTYLYHGRTYTTRLPYDPGPTLRVNVDVSPS
jgi:uncharacterized protein YcfJ